MVLLDVILGRITLLLQIVWVTAILLILFASVPSPTLRPFHQLVSSLSARGKTSSSTKRFTVPQKYFLHFYIVAVVWTTLLLVWFILSYTHWKMIQFDSADHHSIGQISIVWRNHIFLLMLMELQVLRRFFETAYVFGYGSSATMHIAGGRMDLAEFRDYLKPLPQLGWYQWIGTAIFMWGWIHQLRCHTILGSLRKQPETNEYVVPHGDWFEHVSCPHYLAEIVIYGGILFASGGLNLTVWLLFIFVASNLIFAAGKTHRWYYIKFENYPRNRHAIIPKVY
ncbi:3-oxo-5-alpha-steroid 4-dehydrogenase family protein [Zostera marina]|uniref:3-oxo-5-alpha-steroid 4-dehydrogenase family protein n=1 Tax=Zostera marina TaxID=29655 RepID=A0A0K9PH77_ZOSMR|nr:3-oxo-5-alpha-steroid 4-dehydrogenase family protein [Zostera marina]